MSDTHDVSDQLRDDRGRWTADASGHTFIAEGMPSVIVDDPRNADMAQYMANVAGRVANKMDFPVRSMNVTDKDSTFKLNGKDLMMAGHYSPSTGTVTLHANQMVPSATGEVTTHEIEHAKYDAFLKDYKAEWATMAKDQDFINSNPRDDKFMKMDGTLKPPYDERYPTYHAYQTAMLPPISDFAKTDGVTNYSRDWWDAWQNRGANTEQAIHETLAEIAAQRYKGEEISHMMRRPGQDLDGNPTTFLHLRKGIDPIWNTLFKAVDENWKRRRAKK